MTERSELKDLLEDSLNNRAFLYPEDVHLLGVVDDLLAAGYPRPRVIETVDELGAGSVVLNRIGDAWSKNGKNWYRCGSTGGHKQPPYSPFTVLWEGGE